MNEVQFNGTFASGTNTFTGSGTYGGGPGLLVVNLGASVSNYFVFVQVEDSGAAWRTVWAYFDPSGNSQWVYQAALPSLPAGPVRVQVVNNSGSTPTGNVELSEAGVTGGESYLAQEGADACYRREQLAATQHTDLTNIDGDVQAVKAAVNGLTSGGTTLMTLDGDLRTMDTDIKALSGGTGTGGTVDVGNWPTDQTVGFDTNTQQADSGLAEALHEDIWIVVGAIVGCFVLAEVLRRVFPS